MKKGSRLVHRAESEEAKIEVVNPRGQLPPRRRLPMAPRLNSLDGKMIYIVDTGWPYTHQLSDELCNVLSMRFPKTEFNVKDKKGGYGEDDPELWTEIKEKCDAVIMGVGH
jgi:hypothetical protein